MRVRKAKKEDTIRRSSREAQHRRSVGARSGYKVPERATTSTVRASTGLSGFGSKKPFSKGFLYENGRQEDGPKKNNREDDRRDEEDTFDAPLRAVDVATAPEGGREAGAAILQENGGNEEESRDELNDIQGKRHD